MLLAQLGRDSSEGCERERERVAALNPLLKVNAEDLGLRDDGACLKALGQHCGLITRVGANNGELVLVLLKSQPTAPSRPKLECSLQETGFWDNDCFVIDEDRASHPVTRWPLLPTRGLGQKEHETQDQAVIEKRVLVQGRRGGPIRAICTVPSKHVQNIGTSDQVTRVGEGWFLK